MHKDMKEGQKAVLNQMKLQHDEKMKTEDAKLNLMAKLAKFVLENYVMPTLISITIFQSIVFFMYYNNTLYDYQFHSFRREEILSFFYSAGTGTPKAY